jgi:carbamoyltransferase
MSNGKQDNMKGAYLGPSFSNEEIEMFLKSKGAPYVKPIDTVMFEQVAKDLAEEKVVGWLHCRMEFGPQSLRGRSILGDARITQNAVGDEPQDQVSRVV